MLSNILGDILCNTFETEVGRWQIKEENPKAVVYTFLGEKYYELLIYGADNYVSVFLREREIRSVWHNWKRLIDHDSCWTSVIDKFLFKKRLELSIIKYRPFKTFYKVIDVPEEIKNYGL